MPLPAVVVSRSTSQEYVRGNAVVFANEWNRLNGENSRTLTRVGILREE